MSLLVVGLSHRSTSLAMLERAAAPVAETGKVAGELVKREQVAEVLLLSTCNRVEVYAVATTFHGGLAEITNVLARQSGLALDQLSDHLYVHYAVAGVEHLFLWPQGSTRWSSASRRSLDSCVPRTPAPSRRAPSGTPRTR